MVSSLGALKLCELCPVKGTRLASYYAIGTYSVLGAQPILGCISPSGASPELAEIMSEIVNLAAHLGRSGYCPGSRALYYTDGVSPGTKWLLGWSVGAFIECLSGECAERAVCVRDHEEPRTSAFVILARAKAGTHAAFAPSFIHTWLVR